MVYYVEQGFVFGDVCHRSAVMCVANAAILVDNTHERHASKFEEINFLTILYRNAMFGIGQTNKGNIFNPPILLKGSFSIRPNGQDLYAALLKFFVFIFHARQRRAAIRSHEAAQKRQNDWLAAKIQEADGVAVQVGSFKFRSGFARGKNFHLSRSFAFSQISSNIGAVNLPVDVFCWLG